MVILTIILWPMVGYLAIMLMPFSSLTHFTSPALSYMVQFSFSPPGWSLDFPLLVWFPL